MGQIAIVSLIGFSYFFYSKDPEEGIFRAIVGAVVVTFFVLLIFGVGRVFDKDMKS